VWNGEHHFDRYICPAPQVVAAAIAQRTTKICIGTAIVLLPHHNPIRLAEDYALVDLLSGGRFDFGVGRDFLKATYDGFNQAMGGRSPKRQTATECPRCRAAVAHCMVTEDLPVPVAPTSNVAAPPSRPPPSRACSFAPPAECSSPCASAARGPA
jgi:alkanesulfonate monooxygenase SsuD/methylene tetrahydromethanopterin reductase-like flavin-dependent oxidoreductase (luciferase family)